MSINSTAQARKALRIKDVAAITGRSLNVVGDALRSGALTGNQSAPGGTWFTTEAAVDRWIAQGCPRYGRVSA
ncbi:hypothetical protein [Gordonia insulae]|uniref:Helix-turn-helix domain-containing protein n=1 Tax=Gordonia insulae TaxID=2420509 RepID=A0A3G8JEN3_9ACTN|nr:hypothetical protein [Gordonia insulae]AZG43483.1 hypothetical protein D7316_00048 [Gordonia insulae]